CGRACSPALSGGIGGGGPVALPRARSARRTSSAVIPAGVFTEPSSTARYVRISRPRSYRQDVEWTAVGSIPYLPSAATTASFGCWEPADPTCNESPLA